MSDYLLDLNTRAMEAKSVEELPTEEGWQFEPKWDGFRCLAFKADNAVELRAKSGKTLSRYFPEVVEALRRASANNFVLDGELVIPSGNSFRFGALQDRIHPADSRIIKLSMETPALLILFDCLATAPTGSLMDRPLRLRREALEQYAPQLGPRQHVQLSPYTRSRAEALPWLDHVAGALDGVVAKQLDAVYTPGERSMRKVKRLRTADCVVGGFRYALGTHQVGSLLLGLYNSEGKLDHVGYTSAISRAERPVLTKKLEAMAGGAGFTGDAPGGPTRWSTEKSGDWQPIRTELVVEVSYDLVTDHRFRHGTMLVRWRPDKAPEQCTWEQLQDVTTTPTIWRSRDTVLGGVQGLAPDLPSKD